MTVNRSRKYRSTCLFLVTPAINRDKAISHVENWVSEHSFSPNVVASVYPIDNDQFEIELFVIALSFSDAEEQVDKYLNRLVSDINGAEHEEFSRGSNLLTPA